MESGVKSTRQGATIRPRPHILHCSYSYILVYCSYSYILVHLQGTVLLCTAMDPHTPTIATAIQSTAERYLTQHCHFHQMLLVVSVRPVLGHTCQRSLQYIALKVYFGSPALRQYPAFLCRCVHIISFSHCTEMQGGSRVHQCAGSPLLVGQYPAFRHISSVCLAVWVPCSLLHTPVAFSEREKIEKIQRKRRKQD